MDGRERPVGLEAHPHRRDLVAPVMGDLHVLRARLDPLHGPSGGLGAERQNRFLAVDLELAAEPAADLRGDDPDALLVLAHHEREEQLQEVRDLGGGPHRQRAGLVVSDHAARLDRRARRAVVDEAALHDDVGLGDAGLDVAAAQRPLVDLVGAEVGVDEVAALERGLRVGDDGQRVVLDQDVLGGVDHRVAVVADHDGDRIADVLDDLLGQRPVLRHGDVDAGRDPGHREPRLELEVAGDQHREHAGPGLGGLGVDRDDPGVGLGRAHERRVQQARQDDVVDVGGAAGDQARVLLALHRAADEAVVGRGLGGAHAPSPLSASSWMLSRPSADGPDVATPASCGCCAAARTALTML